MRTFVLLALLLVSCATAAPPPPSHADAAGALRAQRALADNDFERALISEELAAVEIERARAAHTVFAYRRFLEEFPTGREATTARALLESLRFDEAKQKNTPLAWESFLAEHSNGAHAVEARERLGALAADAAVESGDLMKVRDVLSRYPEHPRRQELVALEDRLAFAEAKAGTLAQLEAYLAQHPLGAHRVEALDLREQREHAILLGAGDLEQARRRASADPSGRSQGLVDEILYRNAMGTLDLTALDALARDAVEPTRTQAQQSLDSFQRLPFSPVVVKALEIARPSHGLRSLEEVSDVLRAGDPLDRVAALKEAAEYGSWEAARVILDAMGNRYVVVRLASVEALRLLKTAMPEEAWRAFVDGREAEALVNALTAEPWSRVAALRDADGRHDLALVAWREVVRYDPDDLAASARVLDLTRATGDRLAAGAAARHLVTTAALFGDGRWLEPHESSTPALERRDGPGLIVGVPAVVTVLRQLCAALDLAKAGRDALAALREGSQTAELQLYALAVNDADSAIARMSVRRDELEREASRRGFPACDVDPLSARLAKVRAERVEAIATLGRHGDERLLPFFERLKHSPSHEVREAAESAARAVASVIHQR